MVFLFSALLVFVGLAPTSDFDLEGLVLDAGGKPVAEAEIVLTWAHPGEAPRLESMTRTDEQGRFIVPMRTGTNGRAFWPPRTVWARGEDDAIAWRTLHPGNPPAEAIRLVLRPRISTRWTLTGPDGEPVENAHVTPRAIGDETRLLPDVLAQSLMRVTDETGTFWLERIAAEAWTDFTVATSAYGQQWFRRRPNERVGATTLLPTGRVQGRLIGEDPEQLSRRRVRLETIVDGGRAGGEVEVLTDEQGAFVVDRLAAGALIVSVESAGSEAHGAAPRGYGLLSEGETMEVTVELQVPVAIEGRVVEAESGRGVGGAQIHLVGTDEHATTTAGGYWKLSVLPGRYAIGVSIDDRSFVDLGVRHRQWVEVSAHEATEVPDFRLERGRIISGRVVDPAGEAVADAWISAQWTVTTPEGQEIPRAAAFRSDARGSFLLAGLPGGQEVELTVHHRVAVSSEPTSWRIGSPGRLTVQVQPHVRQPLTGRVTRSNGTPVDRARIEVWTRPIGQVHLDHRQVDIASDQQIATDASGAFVWAELLPVDAEYRVVAYPRGEAPFAGEWFAGEALPQAVALTLPTLQSLTGQVVDPEGVPVEGAWIIQAGSGPRPARARSDETGSFEIGGFTARSGLVFAERDGVTFGRVADGKLHLILEPGRGTRALQGPGVEVARDLVPRLLEPSWETALSNPTDPVNLRTFSLMARVDPARVFELIESDELPTAQQRDFLRVALAQYWLLERPDDAHRLIEEAESAEWQTAGLVAAARSLPADEVQGKASLLEKAQALLPKVDDGASRLMRTATVAQEWWAIGEHDRARSLLSEGQKQAARLAPDDGFNQFARGTFASRLARTDLEAALALVGDGAPAKDAYLGEMAVTLAEDRIGDAERVFRALGSDSQRHRWIGELARVMAPRDLIRTRRLIESLGDSGQRAGALAVCAEAVLPYSSERAESLLGEAFDELDKVSISNDEMARVPTAAIGAALLPIAERVAPERVSELLVRSLALRRPVPWPAFLGSEVERLEAEASLALFVARYDGELARALLDDVVSAAGAWIDEPGLSRRILEARTILSPSEAFDSLEREQSVDIRARQSVADLLTTPADEKWQDLRRRHLGLFW